jgi:hypothetical protein
MIELTFQQGTVEWLKARSGIVTGTSLAKAVSTRKNDLLDTLISERMTETEFKELNTEAVLRGKELEPLALKAVIKETEIPFETTGMLFSESINDFGISPDAVYREEGIIVGGLEIKCPDSKNHVQYVRGRVLPNKYRHQVLAPFVASDQIEWWDFVSFDNRNYQIPMFRIRTYRKDVCGEVEDIRRKLKEFIAKVNAEHERLTF